MSLLLNAKMMVESSYETNRKVMQTRLLNDRENKRRLVASLTAMLDSFKKWETAQAIYVNQVTFSCFGERELENNKWMTAIINHQDLVCDVEEALEAIEEKVKTEVIPKQQLSLVKEEDLEYEEMMVDKRRKREESPMQDEETKESPAENRVGRIKDRVGRINMMTKERESRFMDREGRIKERESCTKDSEGSVKERPKEGSVNEGEDSIEEREGPSKDNETEDNPVTQKQKVAVEAALAAGVPAGQQKTVSCVANTSPLREVLVECFGPYEDHRWVNIGKERDGMARDAVQYSKALRPPYHVFSFLRIKGHSTKGMSCTDKNTMVFTVLEGEITVILHTTRFNAKKFDTFYVPPKNYYNLINQKAGEAELSLIQFQYDGPLPTVQATPGTPGSC